MNEIVHCFDLTHSFGAFIGATSVPNFPKPVGHRSYDYAGFLAQVIFVGAQRVNV